MQQLCFADKIDNFKSALRRQGKGSGEAEEREDDQDYNDESDDIDNAVHVTLQADVE